MGALGGLNPRRGDARAEEALEAAKRALADREAAHEAALAAARAESAAERRIVSGVSVRDSRDARETREMQTALALALADAKAHAAAAADADARAALAASSPRRATTPNGKRRSRRRNLRRRRRVSRGGVRISRRRNGDAVPRGATSLSDALAAAERGDDEMTRSAERAAKEEANNAELARRLWLTAKRRRISRSFAASSRRRGAARPTPPRPDPNAGPVAREGPTPRRNSMGWSPSSNATRG